MCIPTLTYAVFGGSRQLSVGPVAMVSLLVESGLSGMLSEEKCPVSYVGGELIRTKQQYEYEECKVEYVKLAILMAAVVGLLQILGRLLNLGYLVSFLGKAWHM